MASFSIIYGPRAFLSLGGIAAIISGTWKAENTFDEQGLKAFENANAAGLEPVAYFDDVSNINKEELDAACQIPWTVLAGWVILAIANLIPHHVGLGWIELEFSLPGMIGLVCCLSIAFILVWPVREAKNERDLKTMNQFYKIAAAFVVVLLGSMTASNPHGPFWYGPFGVACIAASTYRFWKTRKMGESWMRNGRPNWNYVVCNGGGPLYAFGWFLFWVSFCAVKWEEDLIMGAPLLPLFVSVRSIFACFASFIIVFLTAVTEYVTDEFDDLQEGLGRIGKLCGRFSELCLSLCFMIAFALYAMASYFPAETALRKGFNAILVVLFIILGRAYGLLYQKALPNHDANRWSRLGRIILIIFAFLVAFQVFTGWTSTLFTIIGTTLVVIGHKNTMDDRKRGKLYLDTGKPNPNPIVYSTGPLLYSFGWILLAVAMSIPQFVW